MTVSYSDSATPDFEEAKMVFRDPLAYIFDDKWHSIGEKREIIIGRDRTHRLLLVCFTEKKQNSYY